MNMTQCESFELSGMFYFVVQASEKTLTAVLFNIGAGDCVGDKAATAFSQALMSNSALTKLCLNGMLSQSHSGSVNCSFNK